MPEEGSLPLSEQFGDKKDPNKQLPLPNENVSAISQKTEPSPLEDEMRLETVRSALSNKDVDQPEREIFTSPFTYKTSEGLNLEGRIKYREGDPDKGTCWLVKGMNRVDPALMAIRRVQDTLKNNPAEAEYTDSSLWKDDDRSFANALASDGVGVFTVGVQGESQSAFYQSDFHTIAEFYRAGLEQLRKDKDTAITSVIAESGGSIALLDLLTAQSELPDDLATHLQPQRICLVNSPIAGLAPHIKKIYASLPMVDTTAHKALNELLENDQPQYLAGLREKVYQYLSDLKCPEMYFVSGFSANPLQEALGNSLAAIIVGKVKQLETNNDGMVHFPGAIGTFRLDDGRSFIKHPSQKAKAVIIGDKYEGVHHGSTARVGRDVITALAEHGTTQPLPFGDRQIAFDKPIIRLDVGEGQQRRAKQEIEAAPHPTRILYLLKRWPGYSYQVQGPSRNLEILTDSLETQFPGEYQPTIFVSNNTDGEKPGTFTDRQTPDGRHVVANPSFTIFLDYLHKNADNIDILHMVDGWLLMTPQFVWLKALWDKPILLRVTSNHVAEMLSKYPRKPMDWYLNNITKFISQSDEITQTLTEKVHVPPERIEQIDNGVDTKVFHPLSPEERRKLRTTFFPDIAENGVIYNYTGRITQVNKRIDELLETWIKSGLSDKGHALMLVGECVTDKKLGHQGHALFEKYGGKEFGQVGKHNILWTGRVNKEEVARHLQASDVFVLPSTNEGFSNALLEAMATGLPAIVREGVSGNNRVLKPEETGLYFSGIGSDRTGPGLLQQLYAMTNSENRNRMSANALDLIQNNFTRERMAEKYHELYASILKQAASDKK